MMRDIKQRADRIDLKFDHVRNSATKATAFGEFVWSGLTQGTADSRREELEKELGAVLKDTLGGLEKLDYFLNAVECLAVTCLLVFEENRFLCLPQGTSPASVQAVITAARISCPLLIYFKRDAKAFFMPSLLNVEVLALQLVRYIQISQQLCKRMDIVYHHNCFNINLFFIAILQTLDVHFFLLDYRSDNSLGVNLVAQSVKLCFGKRGMTSLWSTLVM
ncbi:unnamed protein product [Oncorhynchus mykiss]|uniref:Uncharacterized protein n=1 Tax=Oncorhynchus mykiss TaxID=8022 RepID=A0A060XVM1_ONCMY|nr:unnamed protein product [Oncorhynchus mykiss]